MAAKELEQRAAETHNFGSVRVNDLDVGRRSIVQKNKMVYAHLEDLIKYATTRRSHSVDTIREFVMDVASGKESYRSAGAKHGISYNTVNTWKRNGWVYEAVELGRQLLQDRLDRRLTGLIDKALDKLDTALEHGDTVIGKDGKLKTKPVSAKDNAFIVSVAFDKRQLLRGEATTIHEEKEEVGNKLQDLAEQFKKFAVREEKTIDGEVVVDEKQSEQGIASDTTDATS